MPSAADANPAMLEAAAPASGLTRERTPPSGPAALASLSNLVPAFSAASPAALTLSLRTEADALAASRIARSCFLISLASAAVIAAANAAADVLLGERYRLPFLLPGTALVALGLYLCTVKA